MLTTNQEEQKQYNIKEYAVKDVDHRNKLTDNTEKVLLENQSQQIYQSQHDHSDELIEWWSTHKNSNGNNTVSEYKGSVSISELIIDIDNEELDRKELLEIT